VLALAVMPQDQPRAGPRPALDWTGVGLLGATMLLLILPLTVGREMQWPWWTFVSLAASVAAGAAFFAWQARLARLARGPLLDLALFAVPGVVPGLIAQTCGRITYFTLLFVLALYVQAGLGASALTSSLTLICWVVAYGFAGPIYPRLPARIARVCAPIGSAITAAAFAGTALASAAHAGTGVLSLILGVGGLGFGLLQTAMTSQLTSTVPKERAPDLSGVLATSSPLCAVIGIATFGSAYIALAAPGGAEAATRAFAIVNAGLALTTVAGVLASLRAIGAARAEPTPTRVVA